MKIITLTKISTQLGNIECSTEEMQVFGNYKSMSYGDDYVE